ncbi:hypothetical protein LWS69_05450, partial [Bordetella hinzii]|nr:hypothetical protein [Bordetella hinzii]
RPPLFLPAVWAGRAWRPRAPFPGPPAPPPRDSQQFGLIAGALASVLVGVWLAASMLKKRRQAAHRGPGNS